MPFKIDNDFTLLAEALECEAKIVATTFQKFPFVMNKVSTMKSQRFAVIIDHFSSLKHVNRLNEFMGRFSKKKLLNR